MLPVIVVIVAFLVIFLGGIALGMWVLSSDDTPDDPVRHKDETQTHRTLTFPPTSPDSNKESRP